MAAIVSATSPRSISSATPPTWRSSRASRGEYLLAPNLRFDRGIIVSGEQDMKHHRQSRRIVTAVLALSVAVSRAIVPSQAAESAGMYAALPGVNLWFTDTGGSGLPVVLLHANTGTSANWE